MTDTIVLLPVCPETLLSFIGHMEQGSKLRAGMRHISGRKCNGWVIAIHPEICSVSVWVEE